MGILTSILNKWRLKRAKGSKKNLVLKGSCYFTNKVVLGNNVYLEEVKFKGQGNIIIGNNVKINSKTIFISDIHNYKTGNAIPYDSTYIIKDIIVEDNVWIGDRSIILMGVRLGKGSIIMPGSVVVKDVPPKTIVAGHPAQEIGKVNG